jgi:hypothetical protein
MGRFSFWLGVFASLSALACTPSKRAPRPPEIDLSDPKCYHNGGQSANRRRRNYPFDVAATVEVASFKGVCEYDFGTIVGEEEKAVQPDTFERVILSDGQIGAFTDILYNYNYSKTTIAFSEDLSGCYYPRQVVLFKDKKGNIFESMEVCFQCVRVESTFEDRNTIQFCAGKYELLKAFFVELGITYFED